MPVADDLRTLMPVRQEREKSHPDQLFRASMLHQCPRKQLLNAKGVELQHPDWLIRKFSLHNGAHGQVEQWVAEQFRGKYEVILEDTIFDPETRCGGHPDIVAVDDQIAHVIEVKTYLQLFKDVPEDSYWQNQISFYWGTLVDQQRWLFVEPLVLIATFDGKVRVIEPAVTEEYKDILGLLNLSYDSDTLPAYMDCYLAHDCKKCELQRACTEPIDSINEWVEQVKRNSYDA